MGGASTLPLLADSIRPGLCLLESSVAVAAGVLPELRAANILHLLPLSCGEDVFLHFLLQGWVWCAGGDAQQDACEGRGTEQGERNRFLNEWFNHGVGHSEAGFCGNQVANQGGGEAGMGSLQDGTDSAGLLLPRPAGPYHIPAWQVLQWTG